jgi:hypothetical protein
MNAKKGRKGGRKGGMDQADLSLCEVNFTA